MRTYELLLIIRSSLDDQTAVGVTEAVVESINARGGEVTTTKVWGRRRLAYPIDNQLEGVYVLLKLVADPAMLEQLGFDLKLNENLLRHMLVKDMNPATVEAVDTNTATAEEDEEDEPDELDDQYAEETPDEEALAA